MNTKGNFRVTRDIYKMDLFKDPIAFRVFFLVLGQAMFKDGVEINGEVLKRGEWLRSYRQLQKDLEYYENRITKQYGIATIKRAVERLEKAEHLECKKTSQCGTLFYVPKYDEWQGIVDFEKAIAERSAEHLSAELRNKKKNELQEINIYPSIQPNAHARRNNFYDRFFMAYGKQPTAHQIQQINAYIDQDGIEEDLLSLAINKAANVTGSFEYLKGILNNWLQKGIRTVDQAKAESDIRRERMNEQQTTKKETIQRAKKEHKYTDIGSDW